MSTYEKLENENREYIVKKLGEFFDNTEDHIVEVLHDKLGTESKTFNLRDTKDSKEYSIVWAPQTVFTSEGAYSIERATISVYPVREASYTHLFTDCIINANKFNKRVLTSKGIKLSDNKVDTCDGSSEFNIGETSDRWNTLNTKEEMTFGQWHDIQRAAESIVKKLDPYYLNILKQKIVDYSHFTIEEFHELASELLTIQCAEEEKQVEKEREEELKDEGFKIEDSIKVQVDDEEFHFINLKTSRGFSIPVNISNFGFLDVEKFIEKLENTKGEE